ncbi:MAG: outer membrane beta-barrel protein [Gillisia sp.]
MDNTKTILLGIIFLMFCNLSVAQNQWTAEFRPGLGFPIDEIAGSDVKTGFGFELTIAYNFLESLGAYAGWGWNEFRAKNALGEANINFEETGYTFGLQFMHPTGLSSLHYLIRAGAIYNHLEAEDNSGNSIANTGRNLGWQLEGGAAIDLSGGFNLRPSVRYRSLPGEFEIGTTTTNADLNYISFGVGLSKTF